LSTDTATTTTTTIKEKVLANNDDQREIYHAFHASLYARSYPSWSQHKREKSPVPPSSVPIGTPRFGHHHHQPVKQKENPADIVDWLDQRQLEQVALNAQSVVTTTTVIVDNSADNAKEEEEEEEEEKKKEAEMKEKADLTYDLPLQKYMRRHGLVFKRALCKGRYHQTKKEETHCALTTSFAHAPTQLFVQFQHPLVQAYYKHHLADKECKVKQPLPTLMCQYCRYKLLTHLYPSVELSDSTSEKWPQPLIEPYINLWCDKCHRSTRFPVFK
jgi:hypothetical protein